MHTNLDQDWAAASAAWYDAHAQAFAGAADGCTTTPYQRRFLDALPPTGAVLDVGCGSGRDMAAFRAAGRDVVGWEPAPALAALARAKGAGPVLHHTLDALPHHGPWAGIWMMAVLLHCPRASWGRHLRAAVGQLLPNGALYACVKAGDGEGIDARGRPFAAMPMPALERLATAIPYTTWSLWSSEEPDSSGQVITWYNILGRRWP